VEVNELFMKEIQIRKAEVSDALAIRAIYEHTTAYSNTLQLPHPSLALWEKRLSNTAENSYVYVAIIDDEIVGNIGFELFSNVRRRHVASFGMAVKDTAQGQGAGSALLSTAINLADNWLNTKRIELTVYSDNETAIHFYKKFGFVIEGEAKAYAFKNGHYVDAYHMARIVEQ